MKTNICKRCNHPLLPQGIRGLNIGKSGSGKTTLLINLLLRPGWLDYNNINIFGKSLFQPEYHILKKAFEGKLPKDVIIRLFKNQNEIMFLNSNYEVEFWRYNSINSLLGFDSKHYSSGFHGSENMVNILTIDSIHVNIDIISGSYANGSTQPTIYSFFKNISPGIKLSKILITLFTFQQLQTRFTASQLG